MRLTYALSIPPEEAVRLLKSRVDEAPGVYRMLPGITTGAPFVGRLSQNTFDIHARQWSYNSLAPRARGRIERTSDGCRVHVELGPSPTTRVGLSVLIGVVGVTSAPVLLSVGYPWQLVVGIAATCVGASVALTRWRGNDPGFPSQESARLQELLNESFGEPTSRE